MDSIAKHLGLGGKNGDGKAFADLWRTDRDKAVAYLRNDVELTARISGVLGVTGMVGAVPAELPY